MTDTLDDLIERRAATDGYYAIAYAMLKLASQLNARGLTTKR